MAGDPLLRRSCYEPIGDRYHWPIALPVIKEMILGEPRYEEEVFAAFRKNGRMTAPGYSGAAWIDTAGDEQTVVDYRTTGVTFKSVEDQQIRRYIQMASFRRRGAYGIQGYGALTWWITLKAII